MSSVKSSRRPQDSTKSVYSIYNAKWWVYEKVSSGKSSDEQPPIYGELEVSYSDGNSSSYSSQKKISFPLVSLWIDPGSTQDLKSCKLHCLLPNPKLTSKNKLEAQDKEYKLDFVNNVYANVELRHNIRPIHSFSVDDRRTILRYGAQDLPYVSYDQHNSYTATPIFDNKSSALDTLIKVIQKYTTAKIAGIDLINLYAVPDRMLVELGFTEVKDYFETAPSMWYGDPLKLISIDQSGSHGYKFNSAKVSEEIVNNFLDILEKELS